MNPSADLPRPEKSSTEVSETKQPTRFEAIWGRIKEIVGKKQEIGRPLELPKAEPLFPSDSGIAKLVDHLKSNPDSLEGQVGEALEELYPALKSITETGILVPQHGHTFEVMDPDTFQTVNPTREQAIELSNLVRIKVQEGLMNGDLQTVYLLTSLEEQRQGAVLERIGAERKKYALIMKQTIPITGSVVEDVKHGNVVDALLKLPTVALFPASQIIHKALTKADTNLDLQSEEVNKGLVNAQFVGEYAQGEARKTGIRASNPAEIVGRFAKVASENQPSQLTPPSSPPVG